MKFFKPLLLLSSLFAVSAKDAAVKTPNQELKQKIQSYQEYRSLQKTTGGRMKLKAYDVFQSLRSLVGTEKSEKAGKEKAKKVLTSSVEPASSSFFSEKLTSFLRHVPQKTALSPSRKLALDPSATYHYSQLGDKFDGGKTAEFSGSDVAMSASGEFVAVGAERYHGKGSTVILKYNPATGGWVQVGNVIEGPSGSYFGNNVELSNDGSRVAIGAEADREYRGTVFIYEFDGTEWKMLGNAIQGTIENGYAGSGLALSGDGSTVAVGSPSANDANGYVSVHRYNAETGIWDILGTPFESQTKSRLGGAVGLSLDGNRVVMGGRIHDVGELDYAGIVRVYDLMDGDWQLNGELTGLDYYDRFGSDVDISDDGTRIIVGALTSDGQFSTSDKEDIGQVVVYEQRGTDWEEIGNIIGDKKSDHLGSSVKISGDGNVIIMGAPGSDDIGPNAGEIKVRIWNPSAAEFQPVGIDIGGECGSDKFGESVAINTDGFRIIVGSRLNSWEGHSCVFQVVEGEKPSASSPEASPTASPSASPTVAPSQYPSPTASPSASPTVAPSQYPTLSPVQCFDIKPNGDPWHDNDGDQYTCEWYSIGPNCVFYGDLAPNNGLTASQACCACGGGSETFSPTRAPTSSPSMYCFNISPNGNEWHDSDGEQYNCEWYSIGGNCGSYGDHLPNHGLTASQACCACGGGSESLSQLSSNKPSLSPSSVPSESPSDSIEAPSSGPSSLPSVVSNSPSLIPSDSPSQVPTMANSPTSSPEESSSSLQNVSTVCIVLIGGFSAWFVL